MSEYLIWSAEHQAWWGPRRCGYSKGVNGAGRYSREEALDICHEALWTSNFLGHASEVPVRAEDIREITNFAIVPHAFMYGKDHL